MVESAERITPPASWREAASWVQMACPGPAVRRFESLSFFTVPGFPDDRIGYWVGSRIYLTEAQAGDPALLVLRHELRHALTNETHGPDWYREPGNAFWLCWVAAEAAFGNPLSVRLERLR